MNRIRNTITTAVLDHRTPGRDHRHRSAPRSPVTGASKLQNPETRGGETR